MDYGFLFSAFETELQGRKLTRQRKLYECLRQAILGGKIASGTRLMATRALADELRMARNSVIYAYERLTDEGFVITTRHGTVVARLGLPPTQVQAPAAEREPELAARVRGLQRERNVLDDMLPFRSGVPALSEFPLPQWRMCMERALRTLGAQHLGYGHAQGHAPLRLAIAEYLKVSRGVRCTLDQVFITDGTQSSLDLCARVLADSGDYAWLENPGYGGARSAFQSAGLQLVPVPVDADGMAPGAAQWQETRPKLIYVTPSHQYPLGSVLSLERRLQLLEGARAAGAWIIEDDYDSEFRHDGPPLSAVQGLVADAPVIYLGTFSKTLFPALRLAFMVVPRSLAAPLARTLGEIGRRGRLVDQIALTEFIDSGLFTGHLRRMRKLYAQRRDALLEALEQHLSQVVTVSGGAGGMHLSARLNLPIADTQVSRAALAQGMVIQPISTYCLPGTSNGNYNGFMLGYAGVPAQDIDGLVRKFGGIIDTESRCGKAKRV